jgi:hypothetical protein
MLVSGLAGTAVQLVSGKHFGIDDLALVRTGTSTVMCASSRAVAPCSCF